MLAIGCASKSAAYMLKFGTVPLLAMCAIVGKELSHLTVMQTQAPYHLILKGIGKPVWVKHRLKATSRDRNTHISLIRSDTSLDLSIIGLLEREN